MVIAAATLAAAAMATKMKVKRTALPPLLQLQLLGVPPML